MSEKGLVEGPPYNRTLPSCLNCLRSAFCFSFSPSILIVFYNTTGWGPVLLPVLAVAGQSVEVTARSNIMIFSVNFESIATIFRQELGIAWNATSWPLPLNG